MAEFDVSGIVAVPSAATAPEWDRFAQACGATFRCSHKASAIWRFEDGLKSGLLRFDIEAAAPQGRIKIGQCAVTVNGRRRAFADALQLLPEYRDLWPDAMRSVVALAGPGQYRYGSDWNIEPCRAADLERIAGIRVSNVHPVDVLAADLAEWPSWESFYAAVSTNAKRNVKKAEKTYGEIRIEERLGRSLYRDIVPLQQARWEMFRRKAIASSRLKLILRSGFRVFATDAYSTSSRMIADGQVVARYLGIDFGRTTFYLEAASGHAAEGASSYLLKSMIEKAYRRTAGKGIFIFGPDDHRSQGQASWEGLVRSRAQWNARPFPTSILHFEVTG